ncbi:MAG TPA: hypothetical protein VNM91_05430 [Dehalococcoidia bacterium]|nr:hypothetical protein [Dehalococcoidia bacterium]
MRAIDLLVARSERIDVPEEFRWARPPGASEALPSVQDAAGRRRLAHAIVLRPASARLGRWTPDAPVAPGLPARRVGQTPGGVTTPPVTARTGM